MVVVEFIAKIITIKFIFHNPFYERCVISLNPEFFYLDTKSQYLHVVGHVSKLKLAETRRSEAMPGVASGRRPAWTRRLSLRVKIDSIYHIRKC
jgi:hypothetical protein